MIKVILGFGNGNLENGCERVTVEIRDFDEKLIARGNGSLPDFPQLWKLYNSWKSSFRSRFAGRIMIPQNSGSSSSEVEMELSECINQFPRTFNQWLNCDGFRPIEKLLRNHINFDTPVSFTVEAEDNQLRRLPWYLWEFFDDYHCTEPTLAFSKYESGRIGKSKRESVRILVVIGDSQGIDTEVDKQVFSESLGDAEVTILSQPSRQDLDESLWDERGWDILAFLGHSGSSEDGQTGSIKINSTENLCLTDLKNALFSAIKKGLQLAIFNSCDGLGLVTQLRDLYLPHTIVMREPVPDKIAQEFIKSFLPAFKGGLSLPIAVREARKKLQKWENIYPCATWLPVLCQNPGVDSINWVNLGGKPACPYRGLFAFKEQDADIFFGREVVSDELYQRVQRREPLIAVVGASGSGKSSVVFAGLVPRLRNNPNIKIVDFRPGRNPFESLAVALAPLWYEAIGIHRNHKNNESIVIQTQESDSKHPSLRKNGGTNNNNHAVGDRQAFLPENRSQNQAKHQSNKDLIAKLKDKRGLCDVVETIINPSVLNSPSVTNPPSVAKSSPHLVIIADQFEELYTLSLQGEENNQNQSELFLDNLLNAVNDSPGFTLVLTLRADFFHHAIKDRKFADALRDTNYPLGPMNREELQRAIRLPAEKQGVRLERGLLETLVDDVGEKAENLPLLEFALTQLWSFQEYGWLKTAAYREIGGLQQSLARHAEDIYTQLNPEQRQQMQRVFIQLVRPGEGAADTRNVVYKSDLQSKDWDLITLLNQEDARLLVINYDQNKRETVEIVHEALINGWGRLNRWMGQHRQFRTWQERLKVGMKNWEEKNKDEGYLLTGGGLGEAEDWLNSQEHFCYLSGSQREFIRLSLDAREKEEAEKERQRLEKTRLQKRAIRWLGGGLLAASVATVFAGFNWASAEIRATSSNLNSLAVSSQSSFDVEFYDDAIMSAMEAGDSFSNTPWKNFIPNDVQQEVKARLFDVINDSIFVKYTLKGHQSSVNSVVFSPDGNSIASGSSDNTIIIWDAKTGEQIKTLKGHQSSVNSVVFSPDGNSIASGSSDNTIIIWDAKTGEQIKTLKGHQGSVNSVVFSPDGNSIASGHEDNKVIIWNAKTGEKIRTLKVYRNKDNDVAIYSPDGNIIGRTIIFSSSVNSVAFSPEGNSIVSGHEDNKVIIWDAKTGEQIKTLKGHQSLVNSVVFSPDGNSIASGSRDNKIIIWDAKTGEKTKTFEGHQSEVMSVVFSPNGDIIASGSSDNKIIIWDAKTGEQIKTVTKYKSEFSSVVFSPDGNSITSGLRDNTIIIWNAKIGEQTKVLEGHQNLVWSMAFSPDGNSITSGSGDNTVIIWDAKTGEQIKTLKGHQSEVMSVVFSPNGNSIASGSRDNTVIIWDAKTGEQIKTLKEYQSEVMSVVFSPDGNSVASAHIPSVDSLSPYSLPYDRSDNMIIIWDAKTGEKIRTLKVYQNQVSSVVFSPDGNSIASGSSDNTIIIWDAKTGEKIKILKGHQNQVSSVVFSPDGNSIASGSRDNTVIIWDAKTGEQIKTLKGHQSEVMSVIFSPDGNSIASGSRDNKIIIWDAKTGEQVKTLEGHQNSVMSVVFSPDGNSIASGSSDNTVIIWNWDFEDLLETGCERFKSHLINHPEKLEQLEVCQNEEIFTEAASTLVEEGKELALGGNFEAAVEKFRKAKVWNPKLDINPERKAVIAFVIQGRELASSTKVEAAVKKFKEAQQLDNNIDLNPQTKKLDNNPKLVAEKIAVPTLIKEGRELASKGNFEAAVETFKKAQQFDNNIDLDPLTEKLDNNPKLVAGKMAVPALIKEGRELASKGNFEEAVEKFKKIQQIDNNIDLNPLTKELDKNPEFVAGEIAAISFVNQGRELLRDGNVKEAIAAYNEALKIDSNPKNHPQYWSDLCWYGAINNQAQEIMFACDKAVKLAPENGSIKGERGLARALTGDYKGAVEDFKVAFALLPAEEKPKSVYPNYIKDLQNEKNPFTPEMLKKWREEK